MPFGNSRLLASLIVAPYIMICEALFFRGRRYLVKLNEHVVGTLVVQEKPATIFIKSLAVAPEFRKLGVATYILNGIEIWAKRIGKRSVELSVLKSNFPALRLYGKFGFVQKQEKKRSFVLVKRVQGGNSQDSFVRVFVRKS